ncbi:MAG: thiol-disulfide isomerase/thioredoxin [Enterobacterales bacterium]|jgi:thiol-disulfide isomerase/thioredoxin
MFVTNKLINRTSFLYHTRLIMRIMCLIIILLLNSCSKEAEFYYVDGREGSLSDFNGQWLLINYWAEWCKPCLEEVPELNEFYSQYATEYSMLAVSFDIVANEELLEQIKKYDMHYPMLASIPTPRLGIDMPAALPANYIRSPEGQIFGPLLGPQTVETLLSAFSKAEKGH